MLVIFKSVSRLPAITNGCSVTTSGEIKNKGFHITSIISYDLYASGTI